MRAKPKGLTEAYAAQFQDEAVVAAYPNRPPYPDAVFRQCVELIGSGPPAVLDLGCGTGDVARRLAPLVGHVDAVDLSQRMIALGKTLPGGDAPNLRWVVGRAEDAPLVPPYGLVTAGESMHWMAWEVVLPRVREALVPGALLAMVARGEDRSPWRDALSTLISRYSTNKDFRPYDVIEELTRRNLFAERGRRVFDALPFEQPVSAYVESIHSRNGFSRDRMAPEDAAAFDEAVRALVTPFAREGMLRLEVGGEMVWGEPAPRADHGGAVPA
jgi:SAM-dependent methyltransferase